MDLKQDNSTQSFIEDDFDFILSRSKKSTQKPAPSQVKHKKAEPTNITPVKIQPTQTESPKFESPKAKSLIIDSLKDEALEVESLEDESIKTKAVRTKYSKPESSKSVSEKTAHQEEMYTGFTSQEDRRNQYIILAIRFVIMPLIAFALTFWLYSVIDNLISHYQYQHFGTTTNAPPDTNH